MSEDKKVLKFGMVGCGGISHAHGFACKTVDSMKFVSCCDVVEEHAKNWAASYGCDSYYTDYVEMIEKEDLDAVLLATWPILERRLVQ